MSFWSIISYSRQQQQTISWLDCDVQWKVDFIWQPEMTSSVVGLKRSSKALPKPNLCQEKKVIITIWWLAACLIYYNILNLSETLHLRSRLSKLMSCTENHKACNQNWSTEKINSSSWQHPILCHTTNTSKVEPIGLQSFASSSIFTWTLTNYRSSSLSTTFAGKTLPQPAECRKMFPKSSQNPDAWIFMLQE